MPVHGDRAPTRDPEAGEDLAGVFDGKHVRLFVDGRLAATDSKLESARKDLPVELDDANPCELTEKKSPNRTGILNMQQLGRQNHC